VTSPFAFTKGFPRQCWKAIFLFTIILHIHQDISEGLALLPSPRFLYGFNNPSGLYLMFDSPVKPETLSAYPQGGAFIALPIGGFQETRFPLL
jgi:hypothetical protein